MNDPVAELIAHTLVQRDIPVGAPEFIRSVTCGFGMFARLSPAQKHELHERTAALVAWRERNRQRSEDAA